MGGRNDIAEDAAWLKINMDFWSNEAEMKGTIKEHI